MGFFDLFKSTESIIESRFNDAVEEAKKNAENEEQLRELVQINAETCKKYLENEISNLPFDKRMEMDLKIDEIYKEVINEFC